MEENLRAVRLKGDLRKWYMDAEIMIEDHMNENWAIRKRRFLMAWFFVRTLEDFGAFLKEVWKRERT